MQQVTDSSSTDSNDPVTGVDVAGRFAVVGTSHHDINGLWSVGAAYVYERLGSSWVQVGKLTSPNTAQYAYFGHSVAIHGRTILVGEYGFDGFKGAAYVFRRTDAGAWNHQATLTASNGTANDQFAWSVDLDGDTAVIGAKSTDSPNTDCGSACKQLIGSCLYLILQTSS